MNISDEGIKLIKSFEGYRNKAYQDVAGIWTIGYGSTRINGEPVIRGMKCDRKLATKWLKNDVKKFEDKVNNDVDVPLTQNMFDALTSFCYNVGSLGNTMKIYLNHNKYKEASDQFDLFIHSGGKVVNGLIKRRKKEKALFVKNMYIKPKDKVTKNSKVLEIMWLQLKLNYCLKHVKLIVNGIYGETTKKAVLTYWKNLGWNKDKKNDGSVAGEKTIDALLHNKKK